MPNKLPFDTFKDTYDGIYRGKVVSNTDPDKLGRIKIEIWPMFEGILADALPWAIPAYPIFEGSGTGIGYFAVPKIDTLVYCFFENGNFNQPIYFAEAPSKVHGIPDSSAINYPNRKVWKTTNGLELIFDDIAKSISLVHPSGAVINIDSEGNINITAAGTVNILAASQVLVNAPELNTIGNLNSGTGATGTFGTPDGALVTVSKGIITDIN
jgi:hypothetical protein